MSRSKSLSLITALLAALTAPASSAVDGIAERPDVQRFIDEMVANHAFERPELEAVFSDVKVRPDILAAIARPAEAKPWRDYRPIFVNAERVRLGVEFWNNHHAALLDAERKYGVPPQIVVAILGVETRYGRQTGRFRVADALSTLAFDYPPRSGFFREQLAQYLLMTREEGTAPLDLYGSYAGAMGQPQFMPSSFRNFAVDFDGDGRRDLWQNARDTIGSVANYFMRHGWMTGGGVVHRAAVEGTAADGLTAASLETTLPFGDLAARGVIASAAIPPGEQVSLLRLEGAEGAEYWVARHNFFVITRYNRSLHYALAVHQLGELIRVERELHLQEGPS